MLRRGLIVVALFLALGSTAQASPYAKATLASCQRESREAVFEARMVAYRRSPKLQLRFRLQAQTPDAPRWRTIDAPGFGTWITVPSGLVKYTYDKTVQNLLAPASYRTVVEFRWRNRRGKVVRSERAVSPVCKLPDTRPDLVIRGVRATDDGYVGVVVNRGRAAAGPFAVDFLGDGESLGTVEVAELAPQVPLTVVLPAAACVAPATIEAVVDPRSQVDEADEENNATSVVCARLD